MGASSLDWFEPAFTNATSIPLALDRVLCIEESKVHFTRCLRAALCNPVPHGPDRIAALTQDIKLLQQTFQHRLGILAIDRPQAWFRHSSTAERGPFAVAVFEEPVFARFDDCRAVAVRHLLPELWRNRQVTCADYDPALSLWGRLLHLNRRLEQINQLPAPFSDVRLDELPDAIPDELQSPALNRFGTQIAQRVKSCQRELDGCYEQLWNRSESFLYALHIQYLSNKAREQEQRRQNPQAKARRQETGGNGRGSQSRDPHDSADSRDRWQGADSRTQQQEQTRSQAHAKSQDGQARAQQDHARAQQEHARSQDHGRAQQEAHARSQDGQARAQQDHARSQAHAKSRQGARQEGVPPPWTQVPAHVGEALRFMEFKALPNFDDLRQRYRVMAHALHPDRGGSEDRFKQLTQHYKRLLQHLEGS